ncbi:MAG: hypothetical protein HC828_01835 [Blastochloris sp.]|nr:hypothetical protein [Blastochloris sp.]
MQSLVRQRILASAFILLVVAVGVVLTVWVAQTLAVQRERYMLDSGLWAPLEAHRQHLRLTFLLQRMALGDVVDPQEYQEHRDLSIGFTDHLIGFADNSTFDDEQRRVVEDINAALTHFQTTAGTDIPDQALAADLAGQMEEISALSYRLANLRRMVAEEGNTTAIQLSYQAQTVQVLTLILLLGASIWFFVVIQRMHRHELTIATIRHQATEESNRHLRASMLQAEELAVAHERERVAREMHDGIGHHLQTAKVYLTIGIQQGTTMEQREALQTVLTELTNAQTELRHAIAAMVSETFSRRSLEELLGEPIRACQLAGIQVSLAVTGNPIPLDTPLRHALFRIGQEAMTNISKHAQATTARICVDYYTPMVRLTIADNGRGMVSDLVALGQGRGLATIRERIDLLGGSLTLVNPPTGGLQLVAEIPSHYSGPTLERVL